MTLNQIAKSLELKCDLSNEITGLNTLKDSIQTELTFLENKKYINDLKNTNAAAVLVKKEHESYVPNGTIALVCDEPYLNLAKASKLFASKLL